MDKCFPPGEFRRQAVGLGSPKWQNEERKEEVIAVCPFIIWHGNFPVSYWD